MGQQIPGSILCRGKIFVSLHNCQAVSAVQPASYSMGKAVPLQARSGPEGSRKLRFPDYMTMAQEGGKFVSPKHRPPLPPSNAPGTPFY